MGYFHLFNSTTVSLNCRITLLTNFRKLSDPFLPFQVFVFCPHSFWTILYMSEPLLLCMCVNLGSCGHVWQHTQVPLNSTLCRQLSPIATATTRPTNRSAPAETSECLISSLKNPFLWALTLAASLPMASPANRLQHPLLPTILLCSSNHWPHQPHRPHLHLEGQRPTESHAPNVPKKRDLSCTWRKSMAGATDPTWNN